MNTWLLHEGWSAWPAPAKLNLFLRILGRQLDGYHELQTVFQLLSWGDTVHLRVRADGEIHCLGSENYNVVANEDLALRAAKILSAFTQCALGVDIFVEKRIPLGGGFGGGSSDAATVLVALNHLWNTKLQEDTLAALGMQLGADVPVFVRGRNAWAEGKGERLTPINLPMAWYLIADPGVLVPTGQLFQAPDLTRAAPPATITDFVSGVALENVFEPVLRRQQPVVDTVLTVLSQQGQACLTGTGSGCFVRFTTQEAATVAAFAVQSHFFRESLPESVNVWVAKGASHSPLLDALSAYEGNKPAKRANSGAGP